MAPHKAPEIPSQENIFLVVGQLLEATKIAAKGIEAVSAESRQTSTTVISIAKTLEIIEDAVGDLNHIVRHGDGKEVALAQRVILQETTIRSIEARCTEQERRNSELQVQLETLQNTALQKPGIRAVTYNILYYGGIVLFSLFNLALTLYGVMK